MIIGVIVVAILLVGGAVILGSRGSGQENSAANTQTQSESTSNFKEVNSNTGDADTAPSTDSRYLEHSDGVLDEYAGKRRVLFFYASWCPTCRPLDADLSAQSDRIPEDVVIIRVNYNDPETDKAEDALATKYGVTYQHTFVEIDENGEVVQKWNGGQMESVLSRLE